MTQIERIQEMEQCMDTSALAFRNLAAALDEYEAAQKASQKLIGYYDSPRWIKDFEDDEAGRLPQDLKRGVLSEDAVYDLIADSRELKIRMMKLLTKTLEKDLP